MTDTWGLDEWLEHLETLHPRKIDLGLERLTVVARRLDLLPVGKPVITVAGTNGKGTVARCATALLLAAGRRVGTYTSPHLLRYNERICIDGIPVSDSLIIQAFVMINTARAEVSLSYFEFATLAALYIFRDQRVDIAVLEVGLGGRLDAVNMVDATVAVVTRIALDHQQWLGNTLDSIATEKAGIVRDGRPVVLAESDYPPALFAVARERGARLQRAGREWHWRSTDEAQLVVTLPDGSEFSTALPAGLQASNVAAALCAVSLAGSRLTADVAARALQGLVFPGRQQHLDYRGLDLILDVAHNPDSAQALARHLAALPPVRTFALVGVLGDKDVAGIIAPLAAFLQAAAVCSLPDTPRSLPAAALARVVKDAGVAVIVEADDPAQAWAQLLPHVPPNSRLVVFGSFHTVGAIMPALLETGVAGALEQTWIPR